MSVTDKSLKLKVVSTAKVVALISVQQNCVMSFICRDWYKKAKYAGLLADIVLRKSQFCCNVNRLISSSLFFSSPLVSVDFLERYCDYSVLVLNYVAPMIGLLI